MSSGINVYLVDIERLKQAIGSGDQSLIDAIVKETRGFLSTIDDIDDEAELTCADAVAELINGQISEDVPGYLYGYALEAICAHLGEELPNVAQIAGASEWMEEVDQILERKGISVRFNGLVYHGSPVPIPEPDDYPFIGQWTAAQVAAAVPAFRAADLSDLDAEMAETIRQMCAWAEAAASQPGSSIVGFLS